MQRIGLGSKTVGGEELFFIVEEGQANSGDFSKAMAMIDAVAATGADAIEFQLVRADDFYVEGYEGYRIYREREFSDSQIKELIGYTRDKGLEFIVSPLSHRLVPRLAEWGCSAFNINASDLTNPDMIDAVSGSKLPFFLSLLLATEEEIEWAVKRIEKNGTENYMLLFGQHTMANSEKVMDVEYTSLGYIRTLKEKRACPVGFIDHTPLLWMPAAAVCAGADVISKHLTLSHEEKGPDWQVCLEPEEMRRAIQSARKMRRSIGKKEKFLAPGEDLDRTMMRRSIVAAHSIEAGEVITRGDIVFKRPGSGICPSLYEEVVGRKVRRKIERDEIITEDMFSE